MIDDDLIYYNIEPFEEKKNQEYKKSIFLFEMETGVDNYESMEMEFNKPIKKSKLQIIEVKKDGRRKRKKRLF